MRKIAIVNFKGGTGKTTTAVNLGGGLAMRGFRVLIIDMDSQGSAGIALGVSHRYTTYHLLIGDESPIECRTWARDNLDIIISDNSLAEAEILLARQPSRKRVLNRKMKEIITYDFILLDCAPSLNLLNQNALIFANEVFVPVSMEHLAFVGLKQVIHNIDMVRETFEHDIKISLIIPTFYDLRNNKSKRILDILHQYLDNKVADPIRTNVSLSEAATVRKTIFEYNLYCHGAVDYGKLVNRVIDEETKE